MMRKLLTVALPLLLPFLLYWAYLSIGRRKAGAAAGTGAAARGPEVPWVWIAAAGVALMIASLAAFGTRGGVAPGTRLVPPTLVDCKIVPSHPAED